MDLGEKIRFPLWEGLPPGVEEAVPDQEIWDRGENKDDILRVSRVTRPELLFYPVPGGGENLPAVIICPGGGYHILAIEHEGSQVARAFNEIGFHALILKYRLPDGERHPGPCYWPLQDAQRSMELVRSRADSLGINPHKIGIMGFSAGGHLAACASTLFGASQIGESAVSLRPDFSLLIYPVVSFTADFQHSGSRQTLLGTGRDDGDFLSFFSPDENIDGDTPPAYLCHAADDKAVPIENSRLYHDGLARFGTKVMMDEIDRGGHGFGMKPDSPAAGWFDRLAEWLATV